VPNPLLVGVVSRVPHHPTVSRPTVWHVRSHGGVKSTGGAVWEHPPKNPRLPWISMLPTTSAVSLWRGGALLPSVGHRGGWGSAYSGNLASVAPEAAGNCPTLFPPCISSDNIELSLGLRAGLLVVLVTSSSLALGGLGFPWSHSLFGPVAIEGESAWDGVLHSSGYVPLRCVPECIGSFFAVHLD